MDGETLEEVSSLGATKSKYGTCKTKISIWIAIATAVKARIEEKHQLSDEVQALQIAGCIHPPLFA